MSRANSGEPTKKIDSTSRDLEKYYSKSHLIVIGISKYKEESPLTNAENDASAIKRILEEQYAFNVITSLFNENATADHIREIFEDTLRRENEIGPKDRILIYYSGHGKLRISRNYKGEEIKHGYIIPYDSRLNYYSSNIPMQTIIEGCQGCLAKHVLLILDCCYSGYAATRSIEPERPKKVTETYVNEIAKRRTIQVLAAGQEDQPVSDSGVRPGYSAFTGALLDILESEKDIDDNGILTASEIGSNLEQEVALQKGANQRPAYSRIMGSEGGDFILKIFRTSNEHVNLSNFVTIHNHGNEITFPAFTAINAMETSLAWQGKPILLSARYVHEKIKKHDELEGEGTTASAVAYVIQQFGAPSEHYWPYKPHERNLPPNVTWQMLDEKASGNKARIYWLSSYEDIPYHLENGRPIFAGFDFYGSWNSSEIIDGERVYLINKERGKLPFPSESDKIMGGHSATIVSYNPEDSSILLANSWGTEWGDNGFCSMSEKLAQFVLHRDAMFAVEVPLRIKP